MPTCTLPRCRHPVRHISFNSHSLITANVPYERVMRNPDLDNFTTYRRSAGARHLPATLSSVGCMLQQGQSGQRKQETGGLQKAQEKCYVWI